jgi:hypothetical protein
MLVDTWRVVLFAAAAHRLYFVALSSSSAIIQQETQCLLAKLIKEEVNKL